MKHRPVAGIPAADIVELVNLLGDGDCRASHGRACIRVAHEAEVRSDCAHRVALDLTGTRFSRQSQRSAADLERFLVVAGQHEHLRVTGQHSCSVDRGRLLGHEFDRMPVGFLRAGKVGRRPERSSESFVQQPLQDRLAAGPGLVGTFAEQLYGTSVFAADLGAVRSPPQEFEPVDARLRGWFGDDVPQLRRPLVLP